MLADPRPDPIADALQTVLDRPDEAAAMALRARRFVEGLTWERAGDQVEAALRSFLAEPSRGPGVSRSAGAATSR
jgi:glycosyltransferase involved in cell wall biosynthesis